MIISTLFIWEHWYDFALIYHQGHQGSNSFPHSDISKKQPTYILHVNLPLEEEEDKVVII